jgi:glyceraldehyde-3-phosphate dehydrogenase/erythrose-4-phosphate dehydrogenase
MHDPGRDQRLRPDGASQARAARLSLIPTSTGSATAFGLNFPELHGKMNGLAVRMPMLNTLLTDGASGPSDREPLEVDTASRSPTRRRTAPQI